MNSSLAPAALPLSSRPLWALSWLIWRVLPGRAATKMAEFSHTEAGSGLDMLAAVEETHRRELRIKYYRHALDELKHSRMFRQRATALATGRSRARAVIADSDYILEHGINTRESLFSRLGEVEFLAFVWVHERRGAWQFEVYADLLKEDADTSRMFDEIARDERFHIAYSKAELARVSEPGPARWAVLRVRGRRLWQTWMRFSHRLGEVVASLWLILLYGLLLGPFSLLARGLEPRSGGLVRTEDPRPAALRAREMG